MATRSTSCVAGGGGGRRDAALRPRGDREARSSATARRRDRDALIDRDVDLCLVLGGDGTILTALRELRGVPAFPSSRSTSARSASWRRSTPTASRTACERALRGRLRGADAAGDRRRRPRRRRSGAINDVSFHRKVGRARRRPRLRDRRGRDRARALRRPRRLHAGRLDRLQPRQRRAGDGVGGGGLRRLLHRAALADRARPRRRAQRPADRAQPLLARTPST